MLTTYVVYYHVVFAIGKETVRPTYVVYYHVVYAVGSGLLRGSNSLFTNGKDHVVINYICGSNSSLSMT
jgi:hypothetical protein